MSHAVHVIQINLKHKQIRVNAGETRNDEGRVLPIYGEMGTLIAAALARYRRKQSEARNSRARSCSTMMRSLPILSFYKARVPRAHGSTFPGQVFHDLRRSAVRNMERAAIPRSVAMKISVHKTEAVYRRYAIVSEQDIADAGTRLEEAAHKRNSRTTTKTTTVRRPEANAKLLNS